MYMKYPHIFSQHEYITTFFTNELLSQQLYSNNLRYSEYDAQCFKEKLSGRLEAYSRLKSHCYNRMGNYKVIMRRE